METGKLIKELRLQKGMTQEELAEKTEVSARTIQRIEKGEVDPRSYTLQMIAQALEVDFQLFLQIKENNGESGQDKIWLGFLHLSGIIPVFFVSILMWNTKKEYHQKFSHHYRSVIRFQLIICGVILGCLWVYWKMNQLTPLFGVMLMNALFTITNAIRVMSGESYLEIPPTKKD